MERAESLQDEQLFELVNQYAQLLQSGNAQECERFLADHPEVLQWKQCLELLDGMAVPANAGRSAITRREAVTIGGDTAAGLGILPVAERFPREFGKYDLLAEIGRGGMGVVYKARDRELNRAVAVKMILPAHVSSAAGLGRFVLEAQAAGAFCHPHIVRIYEFGEVHGQYYFAMDYVEGCSLAELAARGVFDPQRAARYVAAIASAVQCLHNRQMLHRDLKPSNILVDAAGHPYVADFGLVKQLGGSDGPSYAGAIVGTPSYMSPEQAAGDREIGNRADVFSLGAILYELLTGRPPFRAEQPWQTIVQVLEHEPQLPRSIQRNIPHDLEVICMQALRKNADERYPSARALAADLERYLRGEPIEARPANAWERLRRWTRKEPPLFYHLVGIAVAALIVHVKYTINGSDWKLHAFVMSLLGVWAFASLLLQRLMARARWTERSLPDDVVRYLWAGADVAFLTTLLLAVGHPRGGLLIGYPLLIAAAGLFFRVRLVSFMTAASVLGFGYLTWRSPEPNEPVHYPVLYASVLCVLGFIVGYQVYRVRVLSRYYEKTYLS